jgi:hypothetical protein
LNPLFASPNERLPERFVAEHPPHLQRQIIGSSGLEEEGRIAEHFWQRAGAG